ncbi:MAG: DUF262 domain-containing protein [Candidatus Anstonellales archaeon]
MTGIRIDADTKYIIQLIEEDINSGNFYLPSFQRQYVWDENDVRDLIDSIVNNYPIGNIILWKPSNVHEIDPFSKPLINVDKIRDNINERPKSKEVFYVIDGQQRLTSLLLLFNGWKIKRGNEDLCIQPITYNPSDKRFYKSKIRGKDLSSLVKAFYQNDIDELNILRDNTPKDQFEDMKKMINKILHYRVPIYIIETTDNDEQTFKNMAEAFIRINKYGVRIGNLELMLSFLAGAVGGESKNRINEIYEKLYKRFEIDLQPIIRFVFSNFDLKQTQISKVDQFKNNINRISKYNNTDADTIFKRCLKSMEIVIDLLKSELGLSNSSLLPSQTPLVTLASYVYAQNINSLEEIERRERDDIINWFVLVSFNGYYSSQTDTKLDRDIEVVSSSDRFAFKALYDNMKNKGVITKISSKDIEKGKDMNVLRVQGKAYLFLLYILLVKNEADDWNGMLLRKRNLYELARHHIFPKKLMERSIDIQDEEKKEILINNIANITFIHKDVNSEIEDKEPADYLIMYKESAKKHLIPTEENMWYTEQYETFVSYRITEIYRTMKTIFPDITE